LGTLDLGELLCDVVQVDLQRQWAARYPDIELQLIRTNSSTGGLAEGLCDLAVVRTPPDERRFASAVVGQERRYCALATDDPWARQEEVRERTLAIDRRTGSTTTDLWPSGTEPTVEDTQDIDDWLAVITTGHAQPHIPLGDHDLEGVISPTEPHRHSVRAGVLAIGRQHCRRRSFQQRP
jgi:DNA-binding transcriptional LysR family regulator